MTKQFLAFPIRAIPIVGVLTYLLLPPVFVAAQDPPGYNLVWSDDFNGSSLDSSLWTAEFSTNPTNNSLQAYLPQHVAVSNGNMAITSTNTSYGSLPYRSGLAKSKSSQKYGRWEVRAKLPTSTGMWPAIWLLPDTSQYPWPSGGEIDIMENRGNEPFKVSSAFHYGTNPPFNHQYTYKEYSTGENFHAGFHTYAAEWDSSEVRYYVDDNLYHTVYDNNVNNSISNAGPMQLIINTAIGGQFLPNPDSSTVWPQQFLIDSVKVYEPAPVVLEFANGGFDAQGGSLNEWTDFGNSIGNVSVASEAVREGTHSLKLYGEFNGGQSYSGAYQGIAVTAGDEVRAAAESFIRSQDSIARTSNVVSLNIDYFNTVGGAFGTSEYISTDAITIANSATTNNAWKLDELRSTAPAGAVEARLAFVFSQPGNEGGAVHVDSVMFGLHGDYTFTWDGTADSQWTDNRWNGGYRSPSDFDNAVIRTNRVVAAGVAANDVIVESGTLDVTGSLASPLVSVHPAGSLAGGGSIQGALSLAGTLLVDANQTLNVTQSVTLASGTALALESDYNEARGTKTGDFAILSGASISGTFANPDGVNVGSHLGDGRFLWNFDHQATQVVADIYSALMGDANGDGIVDVSDFNIWNTNRFATNADWTMGDFNGDRLVNATDFGLWNSNRFTSTSFFAAVPEPSAQSLIGMGLLLAAATMRLSRRS